MNLDVRHWLEARGFGQYADLFEAHQLEADALTALTEQNLRELGIPLGQRIKLLAAIGEKHDSASSVTPPVERRKLAERRRLTVSFVDLVGSSALAERLDPEDLQAVLTAYREVVAEQTQRFDGSIAQWLGDGAMLYFGHPSAHEDDAERAVCAALAIRRAVSGLRTPFAVDLSVHIGIATGLVVVGDLFGSGAEESAVGETPNLAARLQGLAAPGEIVVSESTRMSLGDLFELRPLGAQQLRGIAKPVNAFVVIRERALDSRFEAKRAMRLIAMVGRDHELQILLECWRSARAGRGGAVLVMGEAGIGKSRLMRALQDAIADEPHARIRLQCSPHHTDSALFPVIQQLTQAAQISANDSHEVRLARFNALFTSNAPQELWLLKALLGVDAGVSAPVDLSPQQQRVRTFDVLLRHLMRLAESQPVLWVLEDAHWIDPTTLEMLEHCITQLGGVRMLAVITARPEFSALASAAVTRVELGRLGRAETERIIEGVAGGKPLPAELTRQIVEKTDGVPLFVEELTRAMLESEAIRETDGAFVISRAVHNISVPASLHDSLMARLDRLRPLKRTAQTAACIGREFSHSLLASVCRAPEPALRGALQGLVDAGIIFVRSAEGDSRYAFKHALVRDAAYESLLRSRRELIHTRIFAALEQAPNTPPEIIAQHAAHAGLKEQAMAYWRKAAVQAIARPAYKEAIAHLTQAISVAEQIGDAPEQREQRLLLWIALGQAMIPLYGYSHSKTAVVFSRASELAESLPQAPHRFSIYYANWVARYVRGEQDQALQMAHSMLESARNDRSEGRLLTALRALAISQMVTGAPEHADATFSEASRLGDRLRQRAQERRIALADRFAADPEIASEFHVGLTIWSLGRVTEARRLVNNALQAARQIRHAHTLGHALAHGAIFALACRDLAQALALSTEAIEHASKHDMELWRGYGSILHGFALALRSENCAGAAAMETGFALLARTQTGAMVPVNRAMYACVLARLGRRDEAHSAAAAVREELRVGSERFYWSECWRLLGDYGRLQQSSLPEIEAAYEESLRIAREQKAKSWELCAAVSLARWWGGMDERRKARNLLAPLLASFSKAESWPGYEEAAAVLDSLG